MGYGQYSVGGGERRKKDDMLADAGVSPAWSRKAGHNRTHYKLADGSQGFILHTTIVAELSADGSRLTLSDGGWYTLTTKSAWGDAVKAFGLVWRGTFQPAAWGSETLEGVTGYWWRGGDYPGKADRSVTYHVANATILGRAGDVAPDMPMIRANVADGSVADGNFAVRFTGSSIKSEAGIEVRCTPFKALVTLLRIDALMREARGYITVRGLALYQFSFDAFGFTIHPGQTARITMIGCHAFRTDDIRAAMKRIAAEHPAAHKAAKAFVRTHRLDYGVKAYQAAQAARYAYPSSIVR